MKLLSNIRTALRRLHREESGQSLVIFVFALVAIMGFTSLVVDTGRIHNEQIKIQNATDSAALAAVNGFPAFSSTYNYALDYANMNCDGLDIRVDYINGSDTVTVTCSKEISYTFAKSSWI